MRTYIKRCKKRVKAFFVSTLLLSAGLAQAQVQINGNVYGGGNIGQVSENTSVIINGGTIGKKIPLEDRKVDANGQITRIRYGSVFGGGNGYDGSDYTQSAPSIDRNFGRVQGNTYVVVGGDAVVRHAVYGGGNLGTVGIIDSFNDDGTANYTANTGKTTVTIEGEALIGPTKADLTTATLEEIQAVFGTSATLADLQKYTDTAFKYLGANEGWVFGSSRGLSGAELKDLAFADTTEVIIQGNAEVVGNVFGGGENGHVQKGTNVLIQDQAIIGGIPLLGSGEYAYPYIVPEGSKYVGAEIHDGVNELYVDELGVGRRIFRGNVFGGGKGIDFVPWLTHDEYDYFAGRVYGNTHLTVSGNALIYNRVYGGGTMASVGTFEHEDESNPHAVTGIVQKNGKDTGQCYVTITGGQIGTNGLNNGEVYGGGRGVVGRPRIGNEPLQPILQAIDLAYAGHTHVTVDGASVIGSVYGGSANGHVQGNTKVFIKETTANKTFIGDANSKGWHGNVYGGGGGTARYTKPNGDKRLSITSGRVFGDTDVEITGGKVYHNVYGGGAIASVGTYDHTSTTQPYLGHGYATVTITGGEIGTDGHENGMVFGSGRGEIDAPGAFMDSLTYLAYTEVNIGKETTSGSGVYEGTAKINGSVYGSGENGHTYLEAVVNIYSGTIGCTAQEYHDYTTEGTTLYDEDWLTDVFPYRGNVYGAGCGTDKYTAVIGTNPSTNQPITEKRYNPNAGYVQGNAYVNIYGGYISRNVYGGGAMASVGVIDHSKTVKHDNTATQTALSWPYYLEFASIPDANGDLVTTGEAKVNIYGGHIGTVAAPVAQSGNVFGSARGDTVGPLYMFDTLALARKTEVLVNYTTPGTSIANNQACIVGSVYGSGENGTVYENTKVTLTKGLIGGSVFGGGSGTDTYAVALKNPDYNPNQPVSPTNQEYLPESQECSITAGKVYGNTEVNINGGTVMHNVYGGGNLASVGKGSYYGYGEMTNETTGPENPYENSGTCTVNITGGTIGTDGLPDENGIINGFVYGSSKGKTFVNINKTPRYDYSRDFFLGYSNETVVNIGDPDEETEPRIYGSVFGGGENGHVRWNTNVTVDKGEIGVAYTAPATYPEADSLIKWVYRGNVYGAGRGIDKIAGSNDYCSSAGSVTLNTNVTVNGGIIHRNVYGGGSNATVGPPPTGYNPGTSLDTVAINGGTIGQKLADGGIYGGDIFGGSRGARDLLTTDNVGKIAVTNNTAVSINTGATVFGTVFGGGEIGQVKQNTEVYMTGGTAENSVYGGGKGDSSDEKAALVLGNATVDMTAGIVQRSIYGGGQLASVGTFTAADTITYTVGVHTGTKVPVPNTCAEGTGLTTVTMRGGTVGVNGSLMPWSNHNPDDDDRGWIFCGGEGLADSITYPRAIAMGVVGSTYLEISNTTSGATTIRPLVTASVYGGCENGLVLDNTHVKIAGGQIGTGFVSKTEDANTGMWVGSFDPIYSEELWQNAILAVQGGDAAVINNIADQFHECDAWDYGDGQGNFHVYDIFYDATSSYHPANTCDTAGYNGHSFFGNVFGGGSGYYPIAPGIWRRSAGRVNGDTYVEVTGGHILTSLYGGNETTDVLGKCTIDMSGGTLGVPRTIQQITDHPVTCYLFGAGMGDTRTMFNTWTNVGSVEVNITGGTIFGSIFGGGEDGHVVGNVELNVGQDEGNSTLIGTWGTSYVDGNVFGGGRGFTGEALTAGVVGGNIDMTITGGTMLGSIFGGGRLASVGTHFTHPESNDYGQFQDGTAHGHVTIDISGGTIGNDKESGVVHTKGGNVYGGSMGRLTLLNNANNPIWPSLAKVKSTSITIRNNALIKSNVYGGGEMGTVCKHKSETDAGETTITISGGTVKRNVFGGGYGSNITTAQVNDSVVPNTTKYASPMQIAGRVYGNTTVSMSAGTVEGGIYGGGEMASVGYITDSIKHPDPTGNWNDLTTGHHSFLSWPYEFTYAPGTGTATVNITGGTVGTPESGNGDVFGGGMGIAGPRHRMAQCANVDNTIVTIEEDEGKTISIKGNVYGGGENGHVNTNAQVTMNSGTVEQDIYGAGKGTDTYPDILYDPSTGEAYANPTNVRSITAGKVYGNTFVTMNDGLVKGNIYGGGEFASVGKSNYMGYGETGDETTAQGSGHTHVYVYGGTVGTDGDGNGMVFGSSQGTTFATINLSPRYFYSRDFFLGYSNNTTVQIGNGTSTPEIKGSVFGGGEDGHVRLSTNVNMKSGTVGETLASGADPNSDAWKLRGNVYGAGRGIDIIPGTTTYCPSAGSVTRNTTVTVEGGTIYRNVYGGGSMAAIGPPPGFTNDPSKCTVNIQGGTIGTSGSTYGGYVYGASRGIACDDATWDASNPTNPSPYTNLASCVETQVNISQADDDIPTIVNNVVYGGGSNGRVGGNTEVNMNGGTVIHGIYGGGEGVYGDVGYTYDSISGRVHGNTLVNLMGGTVGVDDNNYAAHIFGGSRRSMIWGDTEVNVGNRTARSDDYEYHGDITIFGSVYGANNYNGTPYGNATVNVYQTHHVHTPNDNFYPEFPDQIPHNDTLAWLTSLPHEISNYAIHQVFGGSNRIDYTPKRNKKATVHVYQCDQNTIYDVYGGGNAASIGRVDADYTTDANVIIDGGRMFRVFGGGNGNPDPANIYGIADTDIYAGLINQVFGGSNNVGFINAIDLYIEESNQACVQAIGEIFGGGNEAPVVGEIVTTLDCGEGNYGTYYGGSSEATIYGNVTLNVFGGTYNYVFGGSKGTELVPADIKRYPATMAEISTLPEQYQAPLTAYLTAHPDSLGCGGNVTLNIFGGAINRAAFGGSDVNGNIEGKITINVVDLEGVCGLDLLSLYGAGRNTPYTPNYDVPEGKVRMSPEVNVIHGTVKGSVYGGGEGPTATTTANPVVNIGYDAPTMLAIVNKLKQDHPDYQALTDFNPNNATAILESNVYGGGDNAQVQGNTTLNITKANTAVKGHVYGGGHGDVSDINYGLVNGNDTVRISGGQVGYYEYNQWIDDYIAYGGNVFGGGEVAKVVGDTWIEMNGGRLVKNLFGGGMGSAYGDGPQFGGVGGNTHVKVSGNALIDNNVYGGGQMGSVGSGDLDDNTTGVTEVIISGGQIGPFTGSNANVYGGGMGGASNSFKTYANVDSTSVIVCDSALIRGSVYGGAANGHVLAGTRVLVEKGNNTKDKKPIIGTDGMHGGDGHVYGGGQGNTSNFSAGRVGGNTKVVMTDGTVMGCIYGGGNVALTGVDVDGTFASFIDDDQKYDSIQHGMAEVVVSGGIIGNPANDGLDLLRSNQKLGNIYGGGRGDPNEYLEDDFGRAANADVSISGSPTIYGSVFGGGQMANVGHWNNYSDWYTTQTGTTRVTINGAPQIGTALEFDHDNYAIAEPLPIKTLYDTINDVRMISHTSTGNVFGGGQGDMIIDEEGDAEGFEQGHCCTTIVNINMNDGGHIMSSVFGGSEQGAVWGDTKVKIERGVIGTSGIEADSLDVDLDEWVTASNLYRFGSVFGGSYGVDSYKHLHSNDAAVADTANSYAGRVYGNTYVNITGGSICGNVFGGGNMASVGYWNKVLDDNDNLIDFVPAPYPNTIGIKGHAKVNVSGAAIIGPLDPNGLNASVYGGGKGIGDDPDDLRKKYGNVNSTEVTINLGETGHVYGSVFGGGADGHVLRDAVVNITGGTVGTSGLLGEGCVFGGGQGSGWFETTGTGDEEETVFHLIKHCGRVGGNTTVGFTGGTVLGCIYGGGKLALTGVDLEGEPSFMLEDEPTVYDSLNHGLATINISGTATIVGENTVYSTVLGITDGYALLDCDYSVGDIFGGGRGDYDNYQDILAGRVANTSVNISGSPRIYCTVFGGGEIAGVGYWDDEDDKHPFVPKTGASKVTIEGTPVIGTEYEFTNEWYWSHPVEWTMFDTINNVRKLFHTCSGNVFGASQGDAAVTDSPSWVSLGRSRTSTVNINMDANGHIMSSVFGGAEQGTVIGDTYVNITGGTIGQEGLRSGILNSNGGLISYGSYNYGNVFGGGFGVDSLQVQTNDSIVIANDPTLIANVIAGRVYGNTHVNITGGAIRGNVFGGGNMASVGMWTNVLDDDDNVIDYAPVANTGETTVKVSGSTIVGPMDGTGLNAYVFGGGRGIGKDPLNLRKEYCNVNSTQVIVTLNETGDNVGRVYGSLYGGGSDCHVLGNTSVTLNSGVIGTYDAEHNTISSWGGNIFGGGRNFLKTNYAAGRVAGNTHVEMKGGTIYGAIFGGGRHAVTGVGLDGMTMLDGENHGNTNVEVKGGIVGCEDIVTSFIDRPIGEVYGGGKGSMVGITLPGHPSASALFISLVKNTNVEISQANPAVPTRILNTVYGGGETANVGHYTWTTDPNGYEISNIAMKPGTGKTNVTIKGGIIGVDRSVMSYALVPGTYTLACNPVGNVFGGGKGLSDNPANYAQGISTVYGHKNLVDIMGTVGSTTVTVENTSETIRPWVKGSVYGGSASGHVLRDTEVTIAGGQIGAGNSGTADVWYTDGEDNNQFFNPIDYFETEHTDLDDVASEDALYECYHWPYTEPYRPFDILEIAAGNYPCDGKTWFGNVYGGGSGFLPYITRNNNNTADTAVWNRESGKVYGNTKVTITGGHILTNVYGGCETADVGLYDDNLNNISGGNDTIIMTGGTIGVPRTLAQIAAHPLTCYLFGAGKGDPRTQFDTWTNVDSVYVEVSGGIIYGSVFGGGEEGHVMNDVEVVIKDEAIIGTTGTSYVDGNIFGGGRGFSGEALTAGTVGGNVKVDIQDGITLGSVYGGGRLASVGTHFTAPEDDNYGQFQEDTEDKTHGYVTIDISGGRIGNTHEYIYSPDPEHPEKKLEATYGGNVFAGAMGRLTKLDGTTINPLWPSLGKVKQTEVTVSGNAEIWSSVYGGGQFGTVRDNATVNIKGGTIGTDVKHPDYNGTSNNKHYHFGSVYGGGLGSKDMRYDGTYANDSTESNLYKRPVEIAGRVYGNTFVNISGGQVLENVFGGGEVASVGMVKDGNLVKGVATVIVNGGEVGPMDMNGLNAHVYGGSKGVDKDEDNAYKAYCNVNETHVTVEKHIGEGGDVVSSPRVWGSVFGGGSDGHVLGDAAVNFNGGNLGTTGETTWDGNIFGGGQNFSASNLTAGRVGGNATVTVTEGHMLGSIFGGGRLGSVGIDEDGNMQEGDDHGFTLVNVGGDIQTGEIVIGHSAYNNYDRVGGNVYGGGKGIADAPTTIYPQLAKVKQTTVNIMEKSGEETWIEGSVFGSGEDGHVLQDTYVNIYGGQIGGHDYGNLEPCDDPYHGNVYGGGRGVDTYEQGGQQHYSVTAGWVQGNTNVNIYGGHIVRNVYGGGNLASVGDPEEEPINGDYLTGLASVTITGGTVGTVHENENFGNVFGSSHGDVGGEYVDLAFVKNTHVTIGQTAKIYGSVFGGGEDGHVRKNTLVDIEGGVIGDEDDVNMPLDGNVYGGGRGLVSDEMSTTAGEVYGHTTVNIRNSTVNGTTYTPTIWNNVYGGGSQSVVQEYKVVNISDGLVKGNVFGGSREIPTGRTNKAPRWVNMWGGTIEGDLYGCSYFADDDNPSNPYDLKGWTSFVNLSGGTIGKVTDQGVSGGNVYGAGYGGKVKGSVAVLIGQNAIVETSNTGGEFDGINIHRPDTPAIANLDIKGSVFGGSYGSIGSTDWEHSFNVSGYSRVYIDGTDYNTTVSEPTSNGNNFMNIGGGVYGCGTNCESGKEGRNILIRNYGTRNPDGDPDDEFIEASRTLTTVQRGDIILLDNTNVNLSGAADISQSDSDRAFAVLQVDKGVYVTNASGIVLGAVGAPAYIDSIHEIRSLHLKPNTGTSYDHIDCSIDNNWEWIGVKPLGEANTQENARLYYTQTASTTPLVYNQENAIIFNGDSRLYVRYLDKNGGNKKRMYGQLQGFFRMRADYFKPEGTESFAYARPKVTPNNNPIEIAGFNNAVDTRNEGDGGFLSYDTDNNFFTRRGQKVLYYTYQTEGDDGGIDFTKTKQYPYFNIGEYVRSKGRSGMDMEEFREWVLPTITGQIWYVDGRGIGNGGWGKDDYHQLKWGHFPDMPKKTITGDLGIYYDRNDSSHEPVYNDFSQADDIIYVVGPIEAIIEREALNQEINHQLKLYRYPGGHKMSNNQTDFTVVVEGQTVFAPEDDTWNGCESGSTAGPGANLGMMIHANKANFVMENVLVDGLFTENPDDITVHFIPSSYTTQKLKVNKPMVVADNVGNASNNSSLTLKGNKSVDESGKILTDGTILQRGYNGTDAATTWYYDADYVPSGDVHHGGALFVDENVTVNVEDLVTIKGNLQKKGAELTVPCNVYLPTFSKSLTITGTLTATEDVKTEIGITSPKRNTEDSYMQNTFSPVAVAVRTGTTGEGINAVPNAVFDAQAAWEHCNFTDDQQWFFVNHHKLPDSERTTYYSSVSDNKAISNNTLYFGWTWANAIRQQPATGYEVDGNDVSISSKEGLAWLISKSFGLNDQTITNFKGTNIEQTVDLDMLQYVWVPIGDSIQGTNYHPFAGSFDGRGHLVENLIVNFLGKGDRRYERNNYGMFGYVRKGTVNRTFLVSGMIHTLNTADVEETAPNVQLNLGGLVGYLDVNSTIAKSESAINIYYPDLDKYEAKVGGLVAHMEAGAIHSSMAMPNVHISNKSKGLFGGLVGYAKAGSIENSFVNAKFSTTTTTSFTNVSGISAGGMLGNNTNASVRNCYVSLQPGCAYISSANFGAFAATNPTTNNIDSCYIMQNSSYQPILASGQSWKESCGQYAPVIDADKLGYMYADNKVVRTVEGQTKIDTTMFMVLNRWVRWNNRTGGDYVAWARPGLAGINSDLPVLMIDAGDDFQGDFRSVATYAGGPALQYGGPVRDDNELNAAIARLGATDNLFVYGDVLDEVTATPGNEYAKISIHEDASIMKPTGLGSFGNNYVGITFDNSKCTATSTPGINYYLVGLGGFLLPRDWHMFSSPLSDAPLGFNYMLGENNTNAPVSGHTAFNTVSNDPAGYYNNPWMSIAREFNWLTSAGSTECSPNADYRYWMDAAKDGYFPTSRGTLFNDNLSDLFILGSDEYPLAGQNRYPYGMDFYTWYEPDYHWINFKRNGPNHWHSDENDQQINEHIDYWGDPNNYGTLADKNMNEDDLVIGKGYMASIAVQSFMQSHGTLNSGNQSITLTNVGKNCTGWNLVGNPYHGYLDFDAFASNETNYKLLGQRSGHPFYVVYDADGYNSQSSIPMPESAFIYYVATGSDGGAYASRYLHPHQGFFVKMNPAPDATTDKLQFVDGMVNFGGDGINTGGMLESRQGMGETPHLFRHTRINYPLVNLILSSDQGCNDVTVIEFERPEWGGATKLRELSSGNGQFFGYHDGYPYAALFAPEGIDRVPLWFEAKEDDIFTMKWNTANGDFHRMYLIDNKLGVEYDMLANDTYVFEGFKTDYLSRFYIVFDVTGVEEHETVTPFAFFDGSQWIVTGDGDMEFIDLLGRVLWRGRVSGQNRIALPMVADGMYLFRLYDKEGTRVQKVTIHK